MQKDAPSLYSYIDMFRTATEIVLKSEGCAVENQLQPALSEQEILKSIEDTYPVVNFYDPSFPIDREIRQLFAAQAFQGNNLADSWGMLKEARTQMKSSDAHKALQGAKFVLELMNCAYEEIYSPSKPQ